MNLRELVATLECQGKPQASEWPVMVLDTGGCLYEVQDVNFEADLRHEGSTYSGTVFLKIEEIR